MKVYFHVNKFVPKGATPMSDLFKDIEFYFTLNLIKCLTFLFVFEVIFYVALNIYG